MKNNILHLFLIILFSNYAFCQQFLIGAKVQIKSQHFKLLDYSPSMKVHTYQYIGPLTNNYLFQRRVGEVLVGVKNGVVVTLIYNLIPCKDEPRVPKSALKLIEKKWKIPLNLIAHNNWVLATGNKLVSLSLTNNKMTFDKARLVYFTTIKYSILMP
jgi:hypothetical protein